MNGPLEFLRSLGNLCGRTVDERLGNEAGCHAADLERVLADAARYQWLRENISDDGQFFMVGRVLRAPSDFDAAVDVARA